MTTKNRTFISGFLTAATFVGVSSTGFGFGEFERGSLTLETTANATYDSYFIGATDPKDGDFYVSLNPELKYDRKAGLAEITGSLGVTAIRYDKNTRYNNEDINADFHVQLPTSGQRLTGGFEISYLESEVVDYNVLDRIREKSLSGSGNFSYQLGLKTALADTFSAVRILRNDYSNQTILGNNISFLYSDFWYNTSFRLSEGYTRTTSSGDNALNQNLNETSNSISAGLSRPIFGPLLGEASFGYNVIDRGQEQNLFGQSRSSGLFYSFTLHGPFLPPRYFPKIESSASITYQQSQSPGINDQGGKTVTGDIRVAWQARPLTKLTLSADRSVDLSATDLSVDNTQVNFGVDEHLGLASSANASIGYIWRSYPDASRHDRTLQASLGYQHTFNKYLSFGASYQYQDNKSSGAIPASWLLFPTRDYNYSRISSRCTSATFFDQSFDAPVSSLSPMKVFSYWRLLTTSLFATLTIAAASGAGSSEGAGSSSGNSSTGSAYGTNSPSGQNGTGNAAVDNVPTDPAYQLVKGDEISVVIYDEPDLSNSQKIDTRGIIRMPYLGEVTISGQSVRQAENSLEKLLIDKKLLRSPMVNITVRDYASHEVTLIGAVGSPGKYRMPKETSTVEILDVITTMGGFRPTAKSDEVRVTRTLDSGEEKTVTVDVEAMINPRKADRNTPRSFLIYPGDHIFVPERLW